MKRLLLLIVFFSALNIKAQASSTGLLMNMMDIKSTCENFRHQSNLYSGVTYLGTTTLYAIPHFTTDELKSLNIHDTGTQVEKYLVHDGWGHGSVNVYVVCDEEGKIANVIASFCKPIAMSGKDGAMEAASIFTWGEKIMDNEYGSSPRSTGKEYGNESVIRRSYTGSDGVTIYFKLSVNPEGPSYVEIVYSNPW